MSFAKSPYSKPQFLRLLGCRSASRNYEEGCAPVPPRVAELSMLCKSALSFG